VGELTPDQDSISASPLQVDPDCVFPTPGNFSGVVLNASDLICGEDVTKCPRCRACTYPPGAGGPKCTNTKPTNQTFLEFDELHSRYGTSREA
jgi:hypothetical protein